MGNLNLKTENFQKAIEYFQQALQINKFSSAIYTQIAIAQMNTHDYSSALQNLVQSERINNKDTYNLFYKVNCLY
jgi:tetratricopeptide (TPR) repeat protein